MLVISGKDFLQAGYCREQRAQRGLIEEVCRVRGSRFCAVEVQSPQSPQMPSEPEAPEPAGFGHECAAAISGE